MASNGIKKPYFMAMSPMILTLQRGQRDMTIHAYILLWYIVKLFMTHTTAQGYSPCTP
jgi:hypothetical protein